MVRVSRRVRKVAGIKRRPLALSRTAARRQPATSRPLRIVSRSKPTAADSSNRPEGRARQVTTFEEQAVPSQLCKAQRPESRQTVFAGSFWSPLQTVASLATALVRSANAVNAGRSTRRHPPSTKPTTRQTESAEATRRASPFTSQRFHVLFNSLFKVLFNFPSRYLFAIGLEVIFSFRWSLPPALGCILKQPDSEEASSSYRERRHGPDTSFGRSLDQKNAGASQHRQKKSYTLHFGAPQGRAD